MTNELLSRGDALCTRVAFRASVDLISDVFSQFR
jgi:hypothetical protein